MVINPISPTVDFDQDGVQHGFLKLPYSHDQSAWGSIMIPITVVKNGTGPTAVLTGANHGDEYEGPIALYDLAAKIDPVDVSGRIIIVPAFNYPAFLSGTRTSPIDGGNLNRIFPGRPDGTVTEKIADFFQHQILSRADYVLDIHSGGRTLEFVPFAACHVLQDKRQEKRCVEAMQAFNAPYSLMLLEIDSVGMYDTAAEDLGRVFVSTELGGGGSASATTIRIAKKGIENFLKHAGILAGEPLIEPTVNLDMPDGRCYVSCETPGLIEYTVELGDEVEEDQVVAVVHEITRTGRPPALYRAGISGIFTGRHYPGMINMGDIVAVIAVPV
ncbi:MAG: N(2)-acetyl-L-2,4-diaminobutanoate deacetylase DoeB [Alphaproteobacteria bacterium]|nr:N(2)-acetyl-L-2,4-diaminobutanoate deacetylase DoeB [Alphaproteobacteria bacterium]